MSSKPIAKIVRNQHGELLICENSTVIYDKSTGRYFQVPTAKVPIALHNEGVKMMARFSPIAAWSAVISGSFLLIVNLVFCFVNNASSASYGFPFIFAIYIISSIFIHESAHIVMLRICGRRFDKVGFKLHYGILPAFYVRMNQSNLLLWTDKVLVHCAGIWVNLAINLILFFLNDFFWKARAIDLSLKFAVVTLVANAAPALSSDGFRVLLALRKTNECLERGSNPYWVRTIRVLSWVLVVIYGMYMSVPFFLEVNSWMK